MRASVFLIILCGCGLNPAYMDQRHADQVARIAASCEKLGFALGTAENAECTQRMLQSNPTITVR